jgi:AcrR family transcriptional regulator
MRYEKGRKDVSRRRILEVATERFRSEGIAASGLASIMSDAGLTNGAFYPHFKSKAELVRESVRAALEDQSDRIGEWLAAGGIEGVIAAYLSKEHRDHPEQGCVSAALLPELARQPLETRAVLTEDFLRLVRQVAASLPAGTPDPESAALAIFATAIGALQLARAVEGEALSDQILAVGAQAARTLAKGLTEACS